MVRAWSPRTARTASALTMRVPIHDFLPSAGRSIYQRVNQAASRSRNRAINQSILKRRNRARRPDMAQGRAVALRPLHLRPHPLGAPQAIFGSGERFCWCPIFLLRWVGRGRMGARMIADYRHMEKPPTALCWAIPNFLRPKDCPPEKKNGQIEEQQKFWLTLESFRRSWLGVPCLPTPTPAPIFRIRPGQTRPETTRLHPTPPNRPVGRAGPRGHALQARGGRRRGAAA